MSYILDALKKSEKERSRGSVPSIQSLHQEAIETPPKKNYWGYIVFGLILINVVAVAVWSIKNTEKGPEQGLDALNAQSEARDQDGSDIASNVKIPQQTKNKTQIETIVESTGADHTTGGAKQSAKTSKENPNVVFATEPLDVSYDELKQAKQTSNVVIVAGTEDSQQVDLKNVDQAKTDDIVNIADLPEAVKRNLPAISFDGHVYSSDSEQRSVMINGQKMREGQEISNDLLIDEITVDGAVFRYQNYRFRLGALQDWTFR